MVVEVMVLSLCSRGRVVADAGMPGPLPSESDRNLITDSSY